jgi:hypothetical protein
MSAMDMESSFDWEASLEQIFGITTLVMNRNDPDVSVRLLLSDADVAAEICKEFGDDDYLQLVVINHDESTKSRCPYFRVIMDEFVSQSSAPINSHLQSFYESIGMGTLCARVKKAMVVGVYDLINLDRTTSVPIQYSTTHVPVMEMDTRLDSDCLKVCARGLYKQDDLTLCDISGLWIPYHIPMEAQWNIVSYLRSPLADIIDKKISGVCMAWDTFLWPMFMQREPRIPWHIAFLYDVPTVQSTISGATRSFLVPSVAGRVGAVVSV